MSAETYETLRTRVASLDPASGQQRAIVWADAGERIGASRGPSGELEVFIVGEPLIVANAAVARAFVHGRWQTASGQIFSATRLVLPASDPFDAIAALLCVELVSNGTGADPQAGLDRTVNLIEALLRQGTARTTELLGLLGELLVIHALCRRAPNAARTIVASWYGNTRSSRDLQLGSVGIEVKTTTGDRSSHHAQGIRQVELGHAVGGHNETHLFLVSVGVTAAQPASDAYSIAQLAAEILSALAPSSSDSDDSDASASFVDRLRGYGTRGDGYDPTATASSTVFHQAWSVHFVRCYDMTDGAIRVLRTADLAGHTMVTPASISFEIELPDRVTGDLNPVAGVAAAAAKIAEATGLP